MNEREQLQNARNELATSIQLLNRNLKIFASANVNYANSKIMTVKNNILDSFKKIKVQFNEYKEQQNDRRIEKENEKNGLIVQMVRNTVKWLQEIFLMNILKIWKKWSR